MFEGVVTRNIVHGHEGLIILSQKPYLTDGTLREQVTTSHLVLCHFHGLYQTCSSVKIAGLIDITADTNRVILEMQLLA